MNVSGPDARDGNHPQGNNIVGNFFHEIGHFQKQVLPNPFILYTLNRSSHDYASYFNVYELQRFWCSGFMLLSSTNSNVKPQE